MSRLTGVLDHDASVFPEGFSMINKAYSSPYERAEDFANRLAITISELQAQLKRDHAGRAITTQTDTE